MTKKDDVTLVYSYRAPSSGGIPRYNHELLNNLEIDYNQLDVSPVHGDSNLEKLYNALWGRKKFIKNNKDKFSKINHWFQPDIFYEVNDEFNIVTVHDLKSYKATPNFYSLVRKKLIEGRFEETLKSADFFIAVSKQTKKELINEGVSEKRIAVVNNGIKEKFSPMGEKHEKKIGYLGHIGPGKGTPRLLSDWEDSKIYEKGFELKIGGGMGQKGNDLKEKYDKKFDITFLGRIPEEGLVKYYNSLEAFFFPSPYEGFGFPPLEATACETPAFIYKDSKITPEVRKYCWEVESISEVSEILKTISDEECGKRAREVKKRFNWKKVAKKTEKLYKKLL